MFRAIFRLLLLFLMYFGLIRLKFVNTKRTRNYLLVTVLFWPDLKAKAFRIWCKNVMCATSKVKLGQWPQNEVVDSIINCPIISNYYKNRQVYKLLRLDFRGEVGWFSSSTNLYWHVPKVQSRRFGTSLVWKKFSMLTLSNEKNNTDVCLLVVYD